jgi:hypothetical protein
MHAREHQQGVNLDEKSGDQLPDIWWHCTD